MVQYDRSTILHFRKSGEIPVQFYPYCNELRKLHNHWLIREGQQLGLNFSQDTSIESLESV